LARVKNIGVAAGLPATTPLTHPNFRTYAANAGKPYFL
jgi:hypothetical protein